MIVTTNLFSTKTASRLCLWLSSVNLFFLRLLSNFGLEFDELLGNLVVASLPQNSENRPAGLVFGNALEEWKPTGARTLKIDWIGSFLKSVRGNIWRNSGYLKAQFFSRTLSQKMTKVSMLNFKREKRKFRHFSLRKAKSSRKTELL